MFKIFCYIETPLSTLSFTDQYGFRPSVSTTAALIALLHKVTEALETNQYVVVLALDFSKAFDTVRHCSLLEKVSQLDLPDNIYNWIANFYRAMHFSAKRGIAIACRLSVRPSVCLSVCLSVCNVGEL